MAQQQATRRNFIGGMATALSIGGIAPALDAIAANTPQQNAPRATADGEERVPLDPKEYDALAKLGNNENGWGPSAVVMKAMNDAWKYSMRYGYPDGGLVKAIADHHGLKQENVLLGAGSGEILKVVDDALLQQHKKVIGVEPTFNSVYQYATNSKAEAIKIPLLKDFRVDIPAIIRATKLNYRDVGFIYLCNPNNPTGNIIPKQEIKLLLDSIPADVPVLIDEAYHHFVTHPDYATSVPYITEGRQVIIARTFSKIAGLAGMRLGYGLASKELIQRLRPFGGGSINAIVKHGGVAALKDKEYENKIRTMTIALRESTTKALRDSGFEVLPSECNFFMVNLGRDITPVIEEFKKRGVAVGRKFPPMDKWLRVSIGTEPEMAKFLAVFKEVCPAIGLKAKAESGS